MRVLWEEGASEVRAHGLYGNASDKTSFKNNPSENSGITTTLQVRWRKAMQQSKSPMLWQTVSAGGLRVRGRQPEE